MKDEETSNKVKMLTFADDAMSSITRDTITDLLCSIVEKYKKIKHYCNANRLKINSDKTHILFPKSNQRRRGYCDLTVVLDGNLITESRTERVLGLEMDRNALTWRSQVEKIQEDCAKKLITLKRAGKLFSFKQRLETGRAVHLSKLF